MSQPIQPLPVALQAHSTLARWIWTLYRDHANLTDATIMAATGALAPSITKARQALLKSALLNRSPDGLVSVQIPKPDALGPTDPAHSTALDRRVYQTLSHARRQAASIFALKGQPQNIYHAQLPAHLNTFEHIKHPSQGSVYIVADSEAEAVSAGRAERHEPFRWDGAPADRPVVHVCALMDTSGVITLTPTYASRERTAQSFQSLKHAAAQAVRLYESTGQLHHVFHVRVPLTDTTRPLITHRSEGSVYVAAPSEEDVRRITQQERNPAVFAWDGGAADRPVLRQVQVMTPEGQLMEI